LQIANYSSDTLDNRSRFRSRSRSRIDSICTVLSNRKDRRDAQRNAIVFVMPGKFILHSSFCTGEPECKGLKGPQGTGFMIAGSQQVIYYPL
jgi:hypothetical protein